MYGAGKHSTGLTTGELRQRGGNEVHYACVVALGPSLRLHAGHTQLLLLLRAIVSAPLDCERIIVYGRLGWLSCVSCRHFVPAAEAPDADARRVKFFFSSNSGGNFFFSFLLLVLSGKTLAQMYAAAISSLYRRTTQREALLTLGGRARRCLFLFLFFFSESLRDSSRAPS